MASDAQLNDYVGLKKLAPYRSQSLKEGDRRKYGKKKRLREWRKKVKEEGQDEEIMATLKLEKTAENKNSDMAERKKRKSRKGKGKAITNE